MPIEFDKKLRRYYAEVTCRGEYSTAEVLEILSDTIDYAADNGREAALLDATAMTGNPDTMQRYELGRKGAEMQLGKPTLVAMAIVGRQPLIDPERFGETVALNRCAVVKVFEDHDAAVHWLEHTSG